MPGTPLTLEGGALYAFYEVRGGRDGHEDDTHSEDSTGGGGGRGLQFVFSIAEANADGRDHMQASLDAQGRLTIRWDVGRGDDDHRDDCSEGLPAQPASMLDWSWRDATDAGAGPGDCKVDWQGKCDSWGLADSWRRKCGFADFAELRVTTDVDRGTGAQTRADRKDG